MALTGIALRKISLLPSRRKYDARDGTGITPSDPSLYATLLQLIVKPYADSTQTTLSMRIV